jgi:hypothetical protein
MTDDQKTYDPADPDRVKAAKQKSKQREVLKREALRLLMTSPGGRMWMYDLLERCGVFRLSFNRDALLMAFSEGHRDIGNMLLAELLRNFEQSFLLMTKENGNGGRNKPSGSDRTDDTAE